ncbi:putative Acyl-CoA N-acyltransferases (NAT) superfamily protein [Tripterygium wilfordii]|uniref:Putative Acyl-CoA N-acyltransferases (NAT) superfamily protein n=1 Tax=Tripterygium wilfordii TaxID=458696 RepID=A0A7J7DQP5_TRIWF|nr:uncharacterized protein LOC119995801 isoform X2 [Tripterygium wilfordii]KAF5748426.1 putative Acyl-CoA N-acyltransferases (NAT) superfamily protein [Tripterygium wilfordii]
MTTISVQRCEFLSFSNNSLRNYRKFHRIAASWTMTMDSKSFYSRKKEELSIQLPTPSLPQTESSIPHGLRFGRLQPSDEELNLPNKLEFGRFVARQAVLDEEMWTAAWLRAECHYEHRAERYVDNYKRKFADQEYHSIKRRNASQLGQKCTCIVTVRKEVKNVKCNVIKSVVATVDLSIRFLLHGETFPGERRKAPIFCCINKEGQRYGHIANLCVAKWARRRGIAVNMLYFAIESAKLDGVEQVYVHVHRKNKPALELYERRGLEIVEMATSQLSEDQTYLLCLQVVKIH